LGKFNENKKLNELKSYYALYSNNNNDDNINNMNNINNENIYHINDPIDYKNFFIRIFKDHMKSFSGSDQNYIEL